jgi:hypothetical protein
VRQYHTCSACRRFVDRYGGLVTVDPTTGKTTSVLWHEDDAPDFAQHAVSTLRCAVEAAKITGVFRTTRTTWGTPVSHSVKGASMSQPTTWSHLAVVPMLSRLYESRHKKDTAGARMAADRENYRLLSESLHHYRSVIAVASAIVSTGTLHRTEKVQQVATWLQMLATGVQHKNLVWLASATAPPGFSHLNSTVFGSLLNDLVAGTSPEDAARKFNAKMNPVVYQRPQAAPTAGNIARAEELVKEMGLEPALHRRFLRFEELRGFIWRPTEGAPSAGSVFGHLLPRGNTSQTLDCGVMTWVRFREKVLPTVTEMRLVIPGGRAAFGALLTAVDPTAPPILQWDTPLHRNPVSWYMWVHGSPASQWGLRPGTPVAVNAIVQSPAHWDQVYDQHAEHAMLVLDGARETQFAGLALFPETLKAELREVCSTIEAYSKRGTLEGAATGSACGIIMTPGKIGIRLTVTRGVLEETYTIDRWR